MTDTDNLRYSCWLCTVWLV